MDLNFWLVLGLALLHCYAGKLCLSKWIPVRYLLSLSGGIAIALVFAELLPSLSEAQAFVEDSVHSEFMQIVYFLALIGLILFYGIDRLATRSRLQRLDQPRKDIVNLSVFWIHISTFAANNALFSYLLNHTTRALDCFLLFIAIALHYVLNDYHLRQQHPRVYDQLGRWVLSAAIIMGWVISESMPMGGNESIRTAALKAFLAGGIILNALNHELPEHENDFWTFAVGASTYAAFLLML